MGFQSSNSNTYVFLPVFFGKTQVFGPNACNASMLESPCGTDAQELRNAVGPNNKTIEDLFAEYNVDVYLGAHVCWILQRFSLQYSCF